MSPAGWMMMIVSLSFVGWLLTWCLYKVLTASPQDHVVKPPDSVGL